MKTEIKKYCESIGLTDPLLERIKELYEMIIKVIKEEPIEVFIEEYINEEGVRTYTDASFFSEHYFVGVDRFINEDRIIFHSARMKIAAIATKKQDYDFKKATEKSRLDVEVIYENKNFFGKFKASKENCDFLWHIIQKYFVPSVT